MGPDGSERGAVRCLRRGVDGWGWLVSEGRRARGLLGSGWAAARGV